MNSIQLRVRIALFVLFGGLATCGAEGCNVGREGERCNPSLSHDECGGGLACTRPVDCPESYCCPTSGESSNASCKPGCNGGQGSICAAGGEADCPEEAGDDGGGGDGPSE